MLVLADTWKLESERRRVGGDEASTPACTPPGQSRQAMAGDPCAIEWSVLGTGKRCLVVRAAGALPFIPDLSQAF